MADIGKEVFDLSPSTSIMLSTYCVLCDINDRTKDIRARYIYKGDGLCEDHFKRAKEDS